MARRRRNSPISLLPSPRLHTLAIHARCAMGGILAFQSALATLVVDVFEVEGVDVAGDVAGGVVSGCFWLRGRGGWVSGVLGCWAVGVGRRGEGEIGRAHV